MEKKRETCKYWGYKIVLDKWSLWFLGKFWLLFQITYFWVYLELFYYFDSSKNETILIIKYISLDCNNLDDGMIVWKNKLQDMIEVISTYWNGKYKILNY